MNAKLQSAMSKLKSAISEVESCMGEDSEMEEAPEMDQGMDDEMESDLESAPMEAKPKMSSGNEEKKNLVKAMMKKKGF